MTRTSSLPNKATSRSKVEVAMENLVVIEETFSLKIGRTEIDGNV